MASTRTRRPISATRAGGRPAPSPSSWPTWAPPFPVDSRIFHPLDTTVLSLDGAWQMKVTRALPPAASEAAGSRDPGITPAAQELVRETVSAEGWTPVTLPQMVPFFKENDGEAVFRKEINVPPERGRQGHDAVARRAR